MLKTSQLNNSVPNLDKPKDEILYQPIMVRLNDIPPAFDNVLNNKVLDFTKQIDAVKPVLNNFGSLGLLVIKTVNESDERKLKHDHSLKKVIDKLEEFNKKLQDTLRSLLVGDIPDNKNIAEALDILGNIEGQLNNFSRNLQIKKSYQHEISKDINFIKVCGWLLQFVQAHMYLKEGNYKDACSVFAKLTDQNSPGITIIKYVLNSLDQEPGIDGLGIYRELPKDILSQTEFSKVFAYAKLLFEDNRSSSIKILNDYLEQSFSVMNSVVSMAHKYGQDSGKNLEKLYAPLFDALSKKASAELLVQASAACILQSNYTEALDYLADAEKLFIQSNSGAISLQLNIIYNKVLAYLKLERYSEILGTLRNIQHIAEKVPGKYSDILCIAAKTCEALGHSEELYKYFTKAVVYSDKDSILLTHELLQQAGPNILFTAAKDGNVDLVQKILDIGIDVNISNEHTKSPLHIAASKGQTEVVKLLIEKGASIDKTESKFGSTPLALAALFNYTETVKVLLEHKADPNICNRHGMGPLYHAALNGNKEMLELLVKKGEGKVQVVSIHNDSLLHAAAIGFNQSGKGWEVIEWLLDQLVDPSIVNSLQETARDILDHSPFRVITSQGSDFPTNLYDDILECLGYYESAESCDQI